MAKKEKEKKVVYYTDQFHDDFAISRNVKDTKVFKDDYKYIRKNIFFRIGSFIWTEVIAIPILNICSRIGYGLKVKNKQVLKSVKHQGYFLYANHTFGWDPIFHLCNVNPGKQTIVPASHQTFEINPFVTYLVTRFGARPTPSSKEMYANYLKGIEYYYKKGRKILIYPEKHIWPYFNGIRDFTSDTFRYPVSLNAPCISATTIYVKRKHRKKPRIEIYLDGPFYPDNTLLMKDAANKLRDEIHDCMKNRVETLNSYEYIRYVYKEPDPQLDNEQ
ncbi:MAG: hypothetical protein LUD22_01095 [Coprobacillus sp.]|nr:hypothetical protein [Coprobacillus sp.]